MGILSQSASSGPCIEIWKIICLGACLKFSWDAHRKFLYEDLVTSSFRIYIAGPATAVAIMSNLICYCSTSTFA